MNSTRLGTLTLDELKEHPTFGVHPAVQAGQLAGWNQDFIQSYQGMADAMEHITATLRDSEKIL
jgi:N-acetylmuramic acid 6-phosphate (MurNAc-6-P) etherase